MSASDRPVTWPVIALRQFTLTTIQMVTRGGYTEDEIRSELDMILRALRPTRKTGGESR